MYQGEKIIAFADKHKSIIFGLFLSAIVFKHAISNIFLATLLGFFVIQWIHRKRFFFNTRFWGILIFFLWGVASLVWTTDFSNTIRGIGLTLPLFLIPIIISQFSNFEADDLKKTIRIFSISLLTYLFVCLFIAFSLFVEDRQSSHFFYHSLVSLFNNNAIYVSLAVALCILFIFNLTSKNAVDYFLLIFLGVFIVLLASKNLIITTFLLTTLSLFNNKKKIKSGAIISAALIGIVLIVMFSDNPIKDRFLEELNLNLDYVLAGQDFYDYRFNGVELRLFQWRLFFEMITNNQIGILGLGLHNVDYLLNQYFSYYNLYKGYFQINFHNQYLQTIGEIGLVGLALLLFVFFRAINSVIRSGNNYNLLLLLLFLSAFLTESFLNRQKGVFLFVTFYCLLMMNGARKEEKAIQNNQV